MLSEHTLKAIDIVCEGCDIEFKEQVTSHLRGFYKRMQQDPMAKWYGLCHNLYIMLRHIPRLHRYCSKVLSTSFELAGLDGGYPFNSGKHTEYYAEEDYYKNPKRVAWIASNADEAENNT